MPVWNVCELSALQDLHTYTLAHYNIYCNIHVLWKYKKGHPRPYSSDLVSHCYQYCVKQRVLWYMLDMMSQFPLPMCMMSLHFIVDVGFLTMDWSNWFLNTHKLFMSIIYRSNLINLFQLWRSGLQNLTQLPAAVPTSQDFVGQHGLLMHSCPSAPFQTLEYKV